MHHRSVRSRGYTLIEVAMAVAVGATLLAAGVSIQSHVRHVAGMQIAKSQVAAIASALEMYYQKNGYYPNSGNGTAGAHLGTTVYTAISPYLDSNFQPVDAFTSLPYTPKTYISDGNTLPGAWWTDMSALVGQIIICVRNTATPAGEPSMGMTDEGSTMGTTKTFYFGKYYGVMLMGVRGYAEYYIKR